MSAFSDASCNGFVASLKFFYGSVLPKIFSKTAPRILSWFASNLILAIHSVLVVTDALRTPGKTTASVDMNIFTRG